jgi:hypothetical protein
MSKSADAARPGNSASHLWRRSRADRQRNGKAFRVTESVLLVAAATFVLLAFGEFGARIAVPAPLWEWRDFRHARAAATINKAVQYDRMLGWRLKPFIIGRGFNTLEYGFRSNGGAETNVKPGGVLAVGSSFTAGSDVVDGGTWPAQLQELTGWNVNNAGQGGYQADQIVLLGEQLLPLIRPQVLVVDLIPGTIIGTGYASYGWPKPYFTIENSELVVHNSPVPRSQPIDHAGFDIREPLGHFAVIDRFMAALFADFWFSADGNSFVTVSTDEVGVTCRLLQRLKQKADADDVRLVLYLQYGGSEVVDGSRRAVERPTATLSGFYSLKRRIKNVLKPFLLHTARGAPDWYRASERVGECARALSITVADELIPLMAVYRENPNELQKYYHIEPNGAMGHKSPFGNMDVAKRVGAAIGHLNQAADQKSN